MPLSVVGQLWFLGGFFCGTKILGTGRDAHLANLFLWGGLIKMLPFFCRYASIFSALLHPWFLRDKAAVERGALNI